MNMELNNLLKGFQSVVVSYQDISAIYTKLFTQGQVQKLATLLHEIYDEEHVFTLTELQRYCKENGQKEDDFVSEQYELNAGIFRRNLTLIVQSLVEEVGKKFLDRFKQDFSSNGSIQGKESQYEESQNADQSYEKSQYKSNMPEIQEETEQSAGVPQIPTSSTFRAKTSENEIESEQTTPSNKFDLNINDLGKKVQTQPSQGQANSNQNSEKKNYQQQQQYELHQQKLQQQQYELQQQQLYQQQQYQIQQQMLQQQQYELQQQQQQFYQNQQQSEPNKKSVQKNIEEQYRRAYNNEQEREEIYHNAMSSLRNDEFNSIASEGNRYEGFSQYDQDSMNYKANLQKYFKQPGQNNFAHFTPAQYNNQHWSSPERSKALAHKNMTPTTSQRKTKATSPERMNTSGSYVNRSISRWSSSNEQPDPSVLDSEFSYGGGRQKFAKSPKKFHWDINKVPGPGHYELDESNKMVRSVTPDVTFPKSPKVPSYIKKNNNPGPIYYPVKYFSSK